MKQITIYCPDIECDSCIKVLNKTLGNLKGIDKYNISKDSIDVEYKDDLIKAKDIISVIESKGYRAAFEPFTRKTFIERLRDFKENKHKYKIEYKMFKYSFYSLLLFLIFDLVFYYFFNNSIDIKKSLPWMVYANIFVVSLSMAIWHFKSYSSKNITGMVGMMIGMTFGMQSGMMIGTLIGATNGMFLGTMVGMFLGVILGFYTGKCSGIMGGLQGAMSGLMGGTMGGMLGVMLYVDNIRLFMPFFAFFNILIMIGLSYYIYEDMIEENKTIIKKKISFLKFFILSLLFNTILILIILFGPRSGVAGV